MASLTHVEFDSFWNIWFWLIVVISWSMSTHWTMGVPYDAIQMANRKGGIWAEHCEQLAQANIHRYCYYGQTFGLYFAALISFLLAIIGTLGFWFRYEFAQAVFILIAPLIAVHVFSFSLALKAQRLELTGEALRQALSRRRFWNQVIGIASIMVTAAFAAIYAIERETFLY